MHVKRQQRRYADMLQFLQRHGAVERFTAVAFVLARLVEHGHHQCDAVGGAADGGDGAFDVLKMFVRAHVVCKPNI